MSVRRVRKRDGREALFEKSKIASAVRSAQHAVGEHDPLFADEVADLVELALRRRYAWRGDAGAGKKQLYDGSPEADGAGLEAEAAAESVPEIEEIQDLVEVGLVELGRAAVAKAYILYRDRRKRVRDSLTIAADRERLDGQLRHLRVREARGTYPWSKGRIIAALVQEAELSREQAELVASRVEARVVAAELKRISTALIRELVDNELVAMGLSGALARQAPVAIPRYDLRELLGEGQRSPAARRAALDGEHEERQLDLLQVLGGEVMGRYALEDIFTEATVERHSTAALHLEDLRAPHLYLTQGIRCELFLRGSPGVQAAFDALDEIAAQLGSVSRGLVLENPAALLRGLAKPGRGDELESLGTWVSAAAAVARGTDRRLDFASPGPKALAFCGRLVRVLDELYGFDDSKPLPRLFLDRGELSVLLDSTADMRSVVSRLLERGALIPTWAPNGEQFLGPAGRRLPRELGSLGCGGAASLNLSRLARQAGPWREDLFLESLAHLVEEAVEALASLARFQRDTRAARPKELRGRVAYALTPVGLGEAMRMLGDGELRADQGSRILGLMSEAARRFSAKRGISVHLSPHFAGEACKRFAQESQEGQRTHQGLLFDSGHGAEDPVAGLARGYSRGYRLGALPGVVPGRAEAQLLATVPAGSWLPLQIDGPTDPSHQLEAQLEAWELFQEERNTIRQSVSGAVEIPPTAPFFQLDPSSSDSSPRVS